MDVLLNWLGQGGIVALVAAAVLHVIPQSRTEARHAFAWVACSVILALPAVPYGVALAVPVTPAGEAFIPVGPMVSMPVVWWNSPALGILLWAAWSGAQVVRLVVGAAALRVTRRQCLDCPPAVQARLEHWSRVRTTGRPTRVVLSPDVRSAAVLGGGAPLIALAPVLIEHLSDADLDRVVIHEWAHVQRRDDIAQFCQRLVRIVAGWHPGVRWLERQVEIEREVACDEIAVATTGSPKGYATCLTAVAALPLTSRRALPALAVVSSSGLRRRLVRILAVGHGAASERPWRAITFCTSVVVAALALVVGSVHVVSSATIASSLAAVVRPIIASPLATPTSSTSEALAHFAGASASVTRRAVRFDQVDRPPRRDTDRTRIGTDVAGTPLPIAAEPSQPVIWTLEIPTASVTLIAEAQVNAPGQFEPAAHGAEPPARPDGSARAPWAAAADAGTAIGRGSRKAGVATAGFFSGVAKKIAGSF